MSIKWELGWLVILLTLTSYELYAVFARSTRLPTLTRLTVQFVPPEVTLTFIVWLFIHFALHYWRAGRW